MALDVQHDFWGTLSAIGLGIIGVASLAAVVSRNSDTADVISAGGNAFSSGLGTALSPITGYNGQGAGAGSSIGGLSTFPIS